MLHCYLYISAKLSANWNNLALKIQISCDVCSTLYTKYVHTLKSFEVLSLSGAQVQFETWKSK